MTAKATALHTMGAIIAGAGLLGSGLVRIRSQLRTRLRSVTRGWHGRARRSPALSPSAQLGRTCISRSCTTRRISAAFRLSAVWLSSPPEALAKSLTLSIGPNQTFHGTLFIPPLPDGCTYRIVVTLTPVQRAGQPQSWTLNADVHDPHEPLKTCNVMAQLALPLRWLPRSVHRARSDSLVRNSLYLMASTVVTAALGYVFWVVAAHAFTRQQVGIASAVISLCSTMALLTYVGPFAMLIERLPANELSSAWTKVLLRACLATATLTAAATAVVVPVLTASHNYHVFFNSPLPIFLAVIGAAGWTLVNLLGAAFIAARRAGRYLSIQTLVSSTKVLFVLPLALAGASAAGLVEAWVASAALGVVVGTIWLVPRMGLGHRPGGRPHHRASGTADGRPSSDGRSRHRRPAAPPSATFLRRLLGQHLTSVGGAVTPLVLPVLVVLRLGVTQNAYFYITWMIGGVFFMVSPAVASATFAEGVRARSNLHHVVIKALCVIAVLLAPAMLIMIIGGRFSLTFRTRICEVGLLAPSIARNLSTT